MYIRKLQEFKGFINSVEFNDKGAFCSTEYILEQIEEKFGDVYNDDFIKDLKGAIETFTMKVDDFCAAQMERDLVSAITKAKSFDDILFKEYIFSDYLNHKIMDGSYSK